MKLALFLLLTLQSAVCATPSPAKRCGLELLAALSKQENRVVKELCKVGICHGGSEMAVVDLKDLDLSFADELTKKIDRMYFTDEGLPNDMMSESEAASLLHKFGTKLGILINQAISPHEKVKYQMGYVTIEGETFNSVASSSHLDPGYFRVIVHLKGPGTVFYPYNEGGTVQLLPGQIAVFSGKQRGEKSTLHSRPETTESRALIILTYKSSI